jgi:hypothetical protein
VQAVDKRVEYEHIRVFDPSLTREGTPDWLIYLRAAESGRFDGIVTRDISQLEQPEELTALLDTMLTVVTWRHPIEDPIQEWGQLLAYMPHIIRRMELVEREAIGRKSAHVFLLPRPQLGRDNVERVRALLGKRASRERRSFPDVRAAARAEIGKELHRRSLGHLEPLLGPPRPARSPAGSE